MKTKIKPKDKPKELYILEDKTKLKNVVVSNEDPYDKILSSMKEEIWYSDTFDF